LLLIISALFLFSFIPAIFNGETSAGAGKILNLGNLGTVGRCFPWALVIILCGGLCNSSFYALGAIYAKEVGLSPNAIAIFVSTVLLAPALTGWPIGFLADRYTRMRVAALASLTALTVALGLVLVSNLNPLLLGAGASIVGGCMVTMYSLGLSRMIDSVGEENALGAATVGLLTYNFGSLLGPIMSGNAMHLIGVSGFYVAIGLFTCLAFVAATIDAYWPQRCPEKPSYEAASEN